MRNKIRLGLMLAPVLTVFTAVAAHAQVSTSSINTALADVVSTVSTVAGAILLVVLTFVGLLIAAGWGWRFLKRHIGRRI